MIAYNRIYVSATRQHINGTGDGDIDSNGFRQ